MKCAIMQPTYIPWAGYFNLIQSVDHFVFLDNAQFVKQSWQTRNRLLQNSREIYLSIPVKKNLLTAQINKIEVNSSGIWQVKHLKTISQSYAKAPYLDEVMDIMTPVLSNNSPLLIDYTIPIIRSFCNALDLQVELHLSSDVDTEGKRSEKLIDICRSLKCDTYLSPLGSKEYITTDGDFANSELILEYQSYIPSSYSHQKTSEFISHLSIIDIVANIGLDKAKSYIQK